MENASKAILIAGAILIVLMVIAVSIIFVSKTEIFTEMFSNNLSEKEILNHNAIFVSYEGLIPGTRVNTLVSTIEANNHKSDIKVKLTVNLGHPNVHVIPGEGELTAYEAHYVKSAGQIISIIDKTKLYNVIIFYNGQGLIESISVSNP